MTRRQAPRLALALLERFVSGNTPLAGDLIEEFERRQSSAWLWWQVLAAIATSWLEQDNEIRPLPLVDLQPVDALERSRRMSLRFRSVDLSPVSGGGGLGLVALAFLVTSVVPGAWWVLLASTLAGALLGIAIIALHEKSPKPGTTILPHSISVRRTDHN